MAIGYHRINSSAARSKIRAGRRQTGNCEISNEMPDWMTKNALLRPGDEVDHDLFGRGVVIDFALTCVTPVNVRFSDRARMVQYERLVVK